MLASAVQQSVIVVGERTFPFRVNDPIFKMESGDAPKRSDENEKKQSCYVCEASFKVRSSSSAISNNRQMIPEKTTCEFCGWWCCKSCANKKFPFPASLARNASGAPDLDGHSDNGGTNRGSTNADSILEYGQICKVCEYKLYIKDLHSEIDKVIQLKEFKIAQKQHFMEALE